MARGIRKYIFKTIFAPEVAAMRTEHNAVLDELDDIRTKYAALLAKLDADGGVTDTNYGTACALAAATAKKVS